ncbi:MAG: phospholipase D-like domain-containing protein [Kofleriaceae bacterium]
MTLTARELRRISRSQRVVMPAPTLPPELRRYTRGTERWRAGNQLRLLRGGGETFTAMLAAIAGARRTIALETYILVADLTGHRFAAALIERAAAGVTVRLLYDAIGGFGLPAPYLDSLRAAGIEVVDFHPLAPWRRRFNLSQRDHRKVLVVDDEVAFTGGLNIADDYADERDGGHGWYDLHCEMRGPIVADFARSFRRAWVYAGGQPYLTPPTADHVDLTPAGDSFARLIDNALRRRRRAFRRAYLTALNRAERSAYLMNAYFLPDRGLRRAMVRAVARGVDVRVIVPGRSDVALVGLASLYVQGRLARLGVKIHRWRGPMMHAKAAVIDAAWAKVGSYNLDHRSLVGNLEIAVESLDADFAGTLVTEFEAALARTEPFDLARWRARGWLRRITAWIAFRLRRLL